MVSTNGRPDRSAAVAWILLDWAASAFSAILITLVVAYVERVVFADAAWGVPGGVVWAWIMATAMLVSAVLAPFLSAHADRTHGHKRWLLIATAVGAGASLALAAVPLTRGPAYSIWVDRPAARCGSWWARRTRRSPVFPRTAAA